MAKLLNTVAWTASFLAQAKSEGMSKAELAAVEKMISADPTVGELIVGSGGYRVVTFFAHDAMPVYLVAMLAKGSRENFDAREVAAMAAFARRILSGHGGLAP